MARKVHGSIPIPARGHLTATGPVDAIDWYFRPVIGSVMRRRLRWTRDAIFEQPVQRVLEVGYGSGVFQYELAARAEFSVAIDIHESGPLVRERLAEDGLHPRLVRADGCRLPFADRSFDAVVILSALEFVPDPGACLEDCLRVLREDGTLVCLTPREHRWADRLLRLLVGVDPESEFRGGRARAHQAIDTVVPGARHLPRPTWVPSVLAPYEVVVAGSRRRAPRKRTGHA